MLGRFGETLIVDWGLAKATGVSDATDENAGSAPSRLDHSEAPLQPSGSQNDPTRMGSAIGTPGFMSPEQAAGRLDLLGPATDIYGLGATLYCLLTGRPAFRGEVGQMLESLRKGEFPRPRQLDPKIDPTLEAICLRAMACAIGDRYASATALRKDVENWLDDAPVWARPDPLRVRMRRWVIRHRVLAAAAVATLVVGLVFLGILTVMTGRANEQLRLLAEQEKSAKLKAEEERRKADDAKEDAEKQRRQAEAQKSIAEVRREEASATTEFLRSLFTAADPLGMDGHDFRMRKTAFEDPKASQLLAEGVRKVRTRLADQPVVRANVLDTLGNTYRNLGKYAEAAPLLEESLDLRRKKFGETHIDTAASMVNLGLLRHDQGRFDDAVALIRKGLAVRFEILGPDDVLVAKTRLHLARCLSHRFDRLRAEDIQEAESNIVTAENILRRKLGDNHPDVGVAMLARATIALGHSSPYESAGLMTKALGIIGGDSKAPVQLLGKYLLSTAMRRAGQFAEAEKLHKEALDKMVELVGEDHPLVILLLGDLAGLQKAKGDMVAAEANIRKAMTHARNSPLRTSPIALRAALEFAVTMDQMNRPEDAEPVFQDALKFSRESGDPERIREVIDRYAQFLEQRNRQPEAVQLRQSLLK
jgi:eukaryotic-like serine/threonine-protein kinase